MEVCRGGWISSGGGIRSWWPQLRAKILLSVGIWAATASCGWLRLQPRMLLEKPWLQLQPDVSSEVH